jgi:hypothetical protein
MNYQDDWQTVAELARRLETAEAELIQRAKASNKIIAQQTLLIAELFSRFVPELEKPTVILDWDRRAEEI